MSNKSMKVYERRRFLRSVMAAGGAGALLSLGAAQEPAARAEAQQTPGADRASGYRLSAHIRAYYASARS